MCQLFKIHLLVTIALALVACKDQDGSADSPFCDVSADINLQDELGRIYRGTDQNGTFYYIGNPDGEGGGYIPCNGLQGPISIAIGDLVVFSGEVRMVDPDKVDDLFDPAYGGIELFELSKSNQWAEIKSINAQ